MEKADENNNAALMGEDFIKEVDEYSEETHSDDGITNKRHGKRNRADDSESKRTEQSVTTTNVTEKDMRKKIDQMLYGK